MFGFRKREPFNAKKVWEEFDRKFPNKPALSPEIKKWHDLRLSEDKKDENEDIFSEIQLSKIKQIQERKFTDEEILKIKKIQRHRMKRVLKDTLVPVDAKGNHETDFQEFVHGQKIRKSLGKFKLIRLFSALDKGNWKDSIFEDPLLPQLSASLFASGKITQQQNATILERVQNLKDSEHIQTFPILDDKGEFTHEAKTILIPSFHFRLFSALNAEQLNEFKLLIAARPKSEQMFYITKGDMYAQEMKTKEEKKQAPSLGSVLIKLAAINQTGEDNNLNLLHLSAGARDALGIARFGLRNYVKMFPSLGPKNINEIEAGVRKQKRWGALSYPETVPWEDIHEYKNVTNLEATYHDIYHSNIMSTFSKEMQECFLLLVEAVRGVTGTNLKTIWSKEIWDWIDCEFSLFLKENKYIPTEKFRKNTLSITESTQLFIDALLSGSRKKDPKKNYLVANIEDIEYITPLGTIFLLDILQNENKWKEKNIDLNKLDKKNPIKKFYQEIKEIYKKYNMKQDNPQIQILKIIFYQVYKFEHRENEFIDLSNLISESSDVLQSKLKFKKATEKEIKTDLRYAGESKNAICFLFDGWKLSTEPENNVLITDRILETILHEKINDANEKDFTNFKKAIFDLHYKKEKAIQYVQSKKEVVIHHRNLSS